MSSPRNNPIEKILSAEKERKYEKKAQTPEADVKHEKEYFSKHVVRAAIYKHGFHRTQTNLTDLCKDKKDNSHEPKPPRPKSPS